MTINHEGGFEHEMRCAQCNGSGSEPRVSWDEAKAYSGTRAKVALIFIPGLDTSEPLPWLLIFSDREQPMGTVSGSEPELRAFADAIGVEVQ